MAGHRPPPVDSGPTELPGISVEGAEKTTQTGYKADQSSLGKLTEPLLNTPFTVETVTRQLMDDQGVTTLRDALRNVPGISLTSGEGSSQGDSLTIRGFTARNDIFLDGMRRARRRSCSAVARRGYRRAGQQAAERHIEVLELIQRAQPLPAPPPEVPGDPISLVVPVAFSLRR
jgi:outer membrane receptor for ferrienterochelin and colicin